MDLWPDQYRQYFRVYPVSAMKNGPDRSGANFGGKIYIPQSALHKLTTMRISYPMLFEIRSEDSKRQTHAGVLEFTAEEGRAYLPEWMMRTLGARSGSLARISSVSLELGSFVRIQPQSTDFLEVTDPKAVLENALRNFSTLSVNDVIQIRYNDHIYDIKVLEVKPETDRHGVSVVETDLEVDFAPPVGYEEPTGRGFGAGSGAMGPKSEMSRAYEQAVQQARKETPGIRLSGKAVAQPVPTVDRSIYEDRDAPALELPEGQLFFGFPVVPLDEHEGENNGTTPWEYHGKGNTLRSSRKRKDPPV